MAHSTDFKNYLRERLEKFRCDNTAGRIDQADLLLFILENQQVLHDELTLLRREIKDMSTSIVTRDQFDLALKAGITTIVGKIDDLSQKVANGTVTTPEDFSAELATLQSAVNEALTKDPDPAPVDGSTDPNAPAA